MDLQLHLLNGELKTCHEFNYSNFRYINNQLVCQTEDTEIKNQEGVYSLVIHGCTTDMTGKIKCVAVNRMGEAQIEGQLKVVAPVPVAFETQRKICFNC